LSGQLDRLGGPGAGEGEARGRVEPLSASRYRVEFTASSEFHDKLERSRELLSHSVPSGDLAVLIERALDALIANEVRRRMGAGEGRKRRKLKIGSRHVPVEVARMVWERDAARCAFVDDEGRRCSERRFLTLEHRVPYSLGGPPTVENVCLLCSGHNGHTARQAFGAAYVDRKRAERVERTKSVFEQVRTALCRLGFGRVEVARVLTLLNCESSEFLNCESSEFLNCESSEFGAAALVRAALVHLTPQLSSA
jgi:5-methylcytosine-specific restriction endonuclease McrA